MLSNPSFYTHARASIAAVESGRVKRDGAVVDGRIA